MASLSQETTAALARLEAALNAPGIPERAAQDCARLLDKLRRPARISIFGSRAADTRWLLCAILGADPLAGAQGWPAIELAHGDPPRAKVTLADGSTLAREGPPAADLLSSEPVFLSITVPWPALKRMSFLALPATADPAEQAAALAWAARRTDIAIWCTRRFDAAEAAIWAEAPARLKNHALMVQVATDAAPPLACQATEAFEGTFTVARAPERLGQDDKPRGLDRLLARLEADIDEALRADVDAARLFLHRFGHLAAAQAGPRSVEDGPSARGNPAARTRDDSRPDRERVELLSEPLLYLRRRARLLHETLELCEAGAGDWAAEVLAGCTETLEGLRERAARWPEDDFRAHELREAVEEACDVSVLLQAEGGEDQVEDAAVLLEQIRQEFERELAA
ncbi:hypothetical protein DRV85_01535 [Rhodosalinus halophilus]|uniref:Uncharacterized protein n=1 Tax=Rhodosalinus halophilus TaxID=2259333 RepID=A0A365UFK3_9RHOB|nr:hypothetical protein [Rhodosalinus halophilus]RBI87633.1 hypothetical protein DRV85_01535 [Rhodosalinus halophilus]